jgi:hypothetical protein
MLVDELVLLPPRIDPLPTVVDLRPNLPPPGDQGRQNSGVAWAAAALKSYYAGRRGKWDVQFTRFQFSPSWIYNQQNGGVDGGMRPSSALDLLVKQGADSVDFFPYDASDFSTKPDAPSLARANRFTGARWHTLDPATEVLKLAIAQLRPVMVTLPVHPDFDELSAANPVYDDLVGDLRGYHTVVIVGFDDHRGGFCVLNSWGRSWGEGGYGWLAYELTSYVQAAYLLEDSKFKPPFLDNSLYLQEGDYVWRVDEDFGDFFGITADTWSGSKALGQLDGRLYLVHDSQLYQMDRDGAYLPLGAADLDGDVTLATAGSRLIINHDGELTAVDVLTGERTPLNAPTFSGVTPMAGDDEALYVADQGDVYRVDPTNGSAFGLGNQSWPNVTSVTAFDANVYVISEQRLWRIPASQNAGREPVGDDEWSPASTMTNLNGKLYITSYGRLYEVDGQRGSRLPLGGGSAWNLSPLLTAVP